MRETIIQSVLIYIVLTAITGVAYPLAITAVAQLVFPVKANGSLIVEKQSGKTVGSELLGQEFTSKNYFWGRLSATSPAYNAAASSGSNLGPINSALLKNTKARIDALNQASPNQGPVPIDLVTSSSSGLDPDISISSARYQIKRIAGARNIDEKAVNELLSREIEGKQLGCLGEARVNVLKLNMALDQIDPAPARTASGSE